MIIFAMASAAMASAATTGVRDLSIYIPAPESQTSCGNSEDFIELPVIVVDSEYFTDESGFIVDSTDTAEKFAWRQLAVPAILVTAGQFGTWESHARNVNNAVRNQFAQWRGDHYFHADDYVQYLPSVSYLGLGAAGIPARHGFTERAIALGTSWLTMGILVNSVKYTVREKRPAASNRNSFPSGHTATAFMGAELVRREYGTGYGIAAYSVATGIGILRIWNDSHWLGDVLAGAGIGILSAQIGWWLLPCGRRLFGVKGKQQSPSFTVAPSYDAFTSTGGLSINLVW